MLTQKSEGRASRLIFSGAESLVQITLSAIIHKYLIKLPIPFPFAGFQGGGGDKSGLNKWAHQIESGVTFGIAPSKKLSTTAK